MQNKTFKFTLLVVLALAMMLQGIFVGCAPATVGGNESTPSGDVGGSTPDANESTPSDGGGESTPEENVPVITDFEIYQSNSITPTACNYALKSENGKPVTATFRGFFKIQEFGELEYKLYFSNNVDSTFSNGSYSYRNMPTESYKILGATVGTTAGTSALGKINNAVTLTFDGSEERDVAAGEMYWSDAFMLNVPEGNALIFEWKVEYTVIAATNSENVACALYTNDKGTIALTESAPMPALIGCKRENDLRVAFIGDSITMGIGAGNKNYKGWAAQITELMGTDISFWNLGVGYARANDAANSPAWLEKAKNNDVIIICFGVNDINSGIYNGSGQRTASQITNDIKAIAEACKEAGCEVIIFSTPPYTYANASKVQVWSELVTNLKILANMKGYKFFDFASYLGTASDPSKPAYGGHPNAQGCTVVAEAFVASGLIEIPVEE